VEISGRKRFLEAKEEAAGNKKAEEACWKEESRRYDSF
jgi:hypothetical protein